MKNDRDDESDTPAPMTEDPAICKLADQLHLLPAFQHMDMNLLKRMLANNQLLNRKA